MENQTPKKQYDARREEREAERTRAMQGRKLRSMFTWGGAGIFVVLAVWGIVSLGGGGGNGQTAMLLDAVTGADRVQGDLASPVTLVEYGDYQCPACALYAPMVAELVGDFGTKIAFVYRHFPLRSIHMNADLAARAAEAAAAQGKFWEMHDMLYKNQKNWERAGNAAEIFTRYAVSLGLQQKQFEKDIESAVTKEKVNKDYEGGIRAGVNATPTFFINGKKIENPSRYDGFRALIENALREAGTSAPATP